MIAIGPIELLIFCVLLLLVCGVPLMLAGIIGGLIYRQRQRSTNR